MRTLATALRALALALAMALTLTLAVLLAPATSFAQRSPCDDVDCDDHGTCIPERSAAHCLCDSGYSAIGGSCVRLEAPSDPLRARRDPEAGPRVVDFAREQLGRTRAQVAGDGDDALSLGDYLAPGEWWCGDFVSWAYASAGVPLDGGEAGGWLVPNNVAIRVWFDRRGLFIARGSARMASYEPQAGDYLQLESPSGGGHAAIVVRVEGDTIHTIEGNVSGTVEEGHYPRFRQSGWIQGIGVFTPEDAAPTVDAGPDATVIRGRGLRLEASVEDDGPEHRLRLSWEARGPGAGRFADSSEAHTEVHFTRAGTYRVLLTANDGTHHTVDELEVIATDNSAPRVRARMLEQSWLASEARLGGSADDDGVGVHEALVTRWRQVSGPMASTVDSPGALETRVVFPAPGDYRFRLEADDGDRTAHADVSVHVASPLGGCSVGAPANAPWPLALLLLLPLALLRRRKRTR